jgi:Uma2 family endonuclease
MSEAVLFDDPPLTIAAFDDFLDSQADGRPWELVAGRIVGMTNPSQAHEQIVSNIGIRLKAAADRRRCQVFFGGMRVQRSENRGAIDKPRPDLLVRCGPLQRQNFVTDPLVVVEVLSPSTMDTDRGEKLRFYKRLPTLFHVVLVYQDQVRAEHYHRGDTEWELDVLTTPSGTLAFDALGCDVLLADAYFGVEVASSE